MVGCSTYDVLQSVGFNLEVLLNGANRYDVNAASAAINIMAAASKAGTSLLELSPEAAQAFANSGIAVVGVLEGGNHLASVRPTEKASDPVTGPLMANVGEHNRIQNASKSFTGKEWNAGHVHFYIDTAQSGISNPSVIARDMTGQNPQGGRFLSDFGL